MSLLPKCPPGFFFDEDARGYRPYAALNVNRGGVLITSAEGWRQREHPMESMRHSAAGSDAGSRKDVRDSQVRHRTIPAGRSQCVNEGCLNLADPRHTTCSSCRRKDRQGQWRTYFYSAVAARTGR